MDLLSDILSHLKLQGTLYFRTSFTGDWGVRVPDYEQVARFHFAYRGRCVVRVDGVEDPIALDQGDLIIITRGAAHSLLSDQEAEEEIASLDSVLEQSGYTGSGTLVYGTHGKEHETQLICGHFSFDEKINHPLIDQLPPFILIKNYGEQAGAWMEQTLKVIGAEAGREGIGSSLISLKLSEIIFVQALRTYLSRESDPGPGLGGFTDNRIAKTLQAMHLNPGNNWTLHDFAAIAGMSRTSYLTLFNKLMNTSPIGYLTQWRMQLARQRLTESNDAIIKIAESAGYQSEAAFSRVFRKHFDVTPAAYRRNKEGMES
ncbi:MAG: AraC family transcriptional regulator [Pseudomonadales bacterium]|nr:AraC family transcriptional regulator [Pseudomonadales bacterium]